MSKTDLEDSIEDLIKERNPQADAVESLINIAPRQEGVVDTDIEVKTDLDNEAVSVHTMTAAIGDLFEMSPEDFGKKCVLPNIVHKKERKLLSKERASRREIVEVARRPDTIFPEESLERQSVFRRMVTPRRRQVQ